jgi:hypothetical protein
MKCANVQHALAGYLDDTVANTTGSSDRVELRAHLEGCGDCREELQRYRRMAVLLSRASKAVPPADLAVRIKVAAAQAEPTQNWAGRFRHVRDRAEILLDNVFRPITLPATGGFFSAILIFVLALQLILPGIVVQADPNDVPLNLMQPAELLALSDYPESWAPEQHDAELALPHGLLVDVTVDVHGQMSGYEILSGPSSPELRRQLDQMLLFSRFRPMYSFGVAKAGGHVVLSFSAVRVRG